MNNATAGPDPALQEKHVGKPALRLCNSYWNSNVRVATLGLSYVRKIPVVRNFCN